MAGQGERRRPAVHPWSDAALVNVLTAEMLLSAGERGVPGFESVRELVREYEQARIGYITAVNERYRTVTRKRAGLRRLASRIVAAPIDWKTAADRISTARAPAVQPSGRARSMNGSG